MLDGVGGLAERMLARGGLLHFGRGLCSSWTIYFSMVPRALVRSVLELMYELQYGVLCIFTDVTSLTAGHVNTCWNCTC